VLAINFAKNFAGTIRVYDASGRLLTEENISDVLKYQVSTSDLPPGIYYYQIFNNETVVSNSFVKE
jgi:hypothetical protein